MKPAEIEEYNQNGRRMAQKAAEKLKGGFLSNVFGSKEERLDSALEYYKKALDSFKLAKNCSLSRVRVRAYQPRDVKGLPGIEERS